MPCKSAEVKDPKRGVVWRKYQQGEFYHKALTQKKYEYRAGVKTRARTGVLSRGVMEH